MHSPGLMKRDGERSADDFTRKRKTRKMDKTDGGGVGVEYARAGEGESRAV